MKLIPFCFNLLKLQRVQHVNRGRLLLQTPGPVQFMIYMRYIVETNFLEVLNVHQRMTANSKGFIRSHDQIV